MSEERQAIARITAFAALVTGAATLLHLIGLQPWGAWAASLDQITTFVLFVTGAFFVIVALLPALLIALLVKSWRRPILLFLYLIGALVVFALGGRILTSWFDDRAYRRFATRMEPLVGAIERYEHEHGRPPRVLSQLVPDYIASIPEPRVGRLGPLKYEGNDPDSTITQRAYYVLGPGEGGDTDFGDYGPGDRAVLLLECESHGRVLNASLIRFPQDSLSMPFDSSAWHSRPSQRNRMASSVTEWLCSQHPLLVETASRLGKPDHVWDSRPPRRWSLQVSILRGILEDEELRCTPDGYGQMGYSEVLVREYGRWELIEYD